jgi:ferredoxin
MYAVLTDAELTPDPLLEEPVCDGCGKCAEACPAGAIPPEPSLEWRIEGRTFRHGPLDVAKCVAVHQGWDPEFSPFLQEGHDRENPPSYYRFLDRRFRHRSICGARGCVRACMDHLERTGTLQKQYRTPMVEGGQWRIDRDDDASG